MFDIKDKEVQNTQVKDIDVGFVDVKDEQAWPAKLPAGFKEVEYIVSDWNAYINTGYSPKNSPYFKVQFKWRQLSNIKTNDYLYWANNTSVSNNWLSFENTNGFYWNAWATTVFMKHNVSIWTDFEYDIEYRNWTLVSSWTYNGSYWYSTWGWLWNSEFCFFCNGTSHTSYMNARCYYLKMYAWSNYELIRDFVPCYRKSDWVIWLYDLVNKQFYTNAWGGSFTKWPDV